VLVQVIDRTFVPIFFEVFPSMKFDRSKETFPDFDFAEALMISDFNFRISEAQPLNAKISMIDRSIGRKKILCTCK
jgi:hypothetical protein